MNKLNFNNIILVSNVILNIFCITYSLNSSFNLPEDNSALLGKNAKKINRNSILKSKIQIIKNLSKFKAFIIDQGIKESVNPKRKKILLNNCFNIPFISINSYIKKFIKDIPYVPEEAIKVKYNDSTFHIWQNELGIISALDPNKPEGLSDWKPNIIYSLDQSSSKKLDLKYQNLRFILLINKDGSLYLELIKPSSK